MSRIIKLVMVFLILVSCQKDEQRHTVESLIGPWRLFRITLSDNTGEKIFEKCGTVDYRFAAAVYFINLEFRDPHTSIMTFKCDGYQLVSDWFLQGENISFYYGSDKLEGKIVFASNTALFIQFDLQYSPVYLYERGV